MAAVFCNTTIKPSWSIELDYGQPVTLGVFAFPVGSEFVKAMVHNQGTKALGIFDAHAIIPNEPFWIMAENPQDDNDKFPLVKTAAIRAKGLFFEFYP